MVHWESLLPFLVFFFILHCWELNNFSACYLEPCWLLCFIFLHGDPLFCWWELFMVMFVWHGYAPCSPNHKHTVSFFTMSSCQGRLNQYEKVPLEQTTEMNEWEHQYSENISGHQANSQKDLDFIPSHNHFLLHSFVKLLYLYSFCSSDFLFVSLLILKHMGIMLLLWFLWPFLDELICFLYVLFWNPLVQGL